MMKAMYEMSATKRCCVGMRKPVRITPISRRGGVLFALIALFAAGGGTAYADGPLPLVVGVDETCDCDVSQHDSTNESVTVHGILNFNGLNFNGSSDHPSWWIQKDDSSLTTIELGPDAGDVGQMNLSWVNLHGNKKNNVNAAACGIYVGRNGGGANAKLSLGVLAYAQHYFTTFELCANAQTDGDVFDVMELDGYSIFRSTTMKNDTSKPMRITFNNVSRKAILAQIAGFWDNSYFAMPRVGGDIILKGDSNSPVKFATPQTKYNLFSSPANCKGFLRTEGDCDVILDHGSSIAEDKTLFINATNIVWGHAGNLRLTGFGILQPQYSNVLPYGPATGIVRIEGDENLTKSRQRLDMNGTTQHVNGVELVNGGQVINSAAGRAVLVFGGGDADGSACGDFTDGTIDYVKTGAGTLTLGPGSFPSLVVDGGTLSVTGRVSIGVLAVTNATLTFANNDSSLLEAETAFYGPGVSISIPDGAATNVVTTASAISIDSSIPLVKSGPGYLTCFTPENANGAPLRVKGGVLRFGGAVCTNEYWRFVAKKAKENANNHAGIARGKTYNLETADGEDYWVYVPVGLGTICLFSPEGFSPIGFNVMSSVSDTTASSLENGQCCATEGFVADWNNSYIINHINPNSTRDPILNGGTSGNVVHFLNIIDTWTSQNLYDVLAAGTNSGAANWSGGILYTNDFVMLDPEDPATWKTVTWRLPEGAPSPTSYNLRRIVNNRDVNVTDWALQSSPTGEEGTWETLDERTGQTFGRTGMNDQFDFTYNAHVPYLFSSRNAGWRFTTFGSVQVDAGAMLELSDIPDGNIAFNGLTVDCTAGAGTITKFAPAANGRLDLVNVQSGSKLPVRYATGLKIANAVSTGNFDTWSVYVDGVRSPASVPAIEDGILVVHTANGTVLIVK